MTRPKLKKTNLTTTEVMKTDVVISFRETFVLSSCPLTSKALKIMTFWKVLKPLFDNNASNLGKIILVENDAITSADRVIAKMINRFFINIAKKLRLRLYKNSALTVVNSTTPNFDNHVSIKKIREYFPDINYGGYNFTEVTSEGVKNEILDLNVTKSSINASKLATVLNQSTEIHVPFLTQQINHMSTKSDFRRELKNSRVILVYKKENHLKKEYYRPVSLLPHVPKVFERIICK